VGGQRSERQKWLQCFEDVTAVIFCVAMSEYDLKLWEDETVNRMDDSLELFESLCNNKWLAKVPFILFLNKRDIFEEKIKRVDLNVCFPEYSGGKDFENASQFLIQKFQNANKHRKIVYTHITTATDTTNIQLVWTAVKDIVLRDTLKHMGVDGF